MHTPLVEAFQSHRPHDDVVLAVDSYEERAAAEKFRDDFKIPFPLLLDTDGTVTSRYNIQGTPTNFFIERRGRCAIWWWAARARTLISTRKSRHYWKRQ